MTNEPEEYTPADAIRDAVAENMAAGADPKPAPPAAEIPAKPAPSGPQAVQVASVSQADVAANLPARQAYSGPEAVVSPAQAIQQLGRDVNPDYHGSPEPNVRTEERPAPLDLSPLLTAIKELSETIKTLKPSEEKSSATGPDAKAEQKPVERQIPEAAWDDTDSRRRTTSRMPGPRDDRGEGFSPEERASLRRVWEQPAREQPREPEPQRQPPRPAVQQPAQSMQQQAPMAMGGGQSQQPTGDMAASKFQQEMQKFLSSNAEALQKVLGIVESVTTAVDQQNRQMAQMQAHLSQLSQFASSTMQRSQKAGYR